MWQIKLAYPEVGDRERERERENTGLLSGRTGSRAPALSAARRSQRSLGVSEFVLADAVDALDDHAVARVDSDQRRRVVDHFAAVQAAPQRVRREHALPGDAVDVTARVAVHEAATNRLAERHRPTQQLKPVTTTSGQSNVT